MQARRGGATLVEVLVAMFIMAIGMLTLLALFPLGALSMAQAIKDDRTAHCAANASAIAKLRWHDFQPTPNPWKLGRFPIDPNYYPAMFQAGGQPASGRSLPVYVDPYGLNHGYAATVASVTNFPRVSPTNHNPGPGPTRNTAVNWTTTTPAPQLQWFTLMDDFNYEANGVPQGGTSANDGNILQQLNDPMQRDDRYTWAWLLQFPDVTKLLTNVDPDMTVVVYSGRPQLGSSEQTFSSAQFLDRNVIRINYSGQDRPAVRKGGWILDATINLSANPPNVQGKFYRVVNVTDVDPTTVDLELQTELPDFGPGVTGTVVVLGGVVEVFPRGGT
jgi:hypothetical protein